MKQQARAQNLTVVRAVITRADGTVEDLGVISTPPLPPLWDLRNRALRRRLLTHRKGT